MTKPIPQRIPMLALTAPTLLTDKEVEEFKLFLINNLTHQKKEVIVLPLPKTYCNNQKRET